MQMLAGGSLTDSKAFIQSGASVPYYFTALPLQSSGQNKVKSTAENGNAQTATSQQSTGQITSVAVSGNVTRQDDPSISYSFALGDVSVDGASIDFPDPQSDVQFSGIDTLNLYLQSNGFIVNDSSKLFYSVSYGPKNFGNTGTAFTNSGYLNFKVQLIDAASGEVLGSYDDVTYNSLQKGEYDNILYRVQCAGIGKRTVKLRLIVSDNTGKENKYDYARLMDAEPIEKTNAKLLPGKAGNDTPTFGVLLQNASKMKEITFKGDAVGQNSTLVKVSSYELSQNYPNPFNPATVINYQLPKAGHVTLRIYNTIGREVAKLIDEEKQAGSYHVEFNASSLPSGVYFYQLECNDFKAIKKMAFIK